MSVERTARLEGRIRDLEGALARSSTDRALYRQALEDIEQLVHHEVGSDGKPVPAKPIGDHAALRVWRRADGVLNPRDTGANDDRG